MKRIIKFSIIIQLVIVFFTSMLLVESKASMICIALIIVCPLAIAIVWKYGLTINDKLYFNKLLDKLED